MTRITRMLNEPQREHELNADCVRVPSAFHPWLRRPYRVIRVFRGFMPVPRCRLPAGENKWPKEGFLLPSSRPGSLLGSFWVRPGFILGSFWVRPGFALG